MISIQKSFGVLPDALALESQRAQLLASNIANADTPNYKAKDINFRQAMQTVTGHSAQLPLTITHSNDIQASGASGSIRQPVLYQVPFQPSLDGNTVDLQHNEAEFGQNAVRYQATLTFLKDRITGLHNAILGQ